MIDTIDIQRLIRKIKMNTEYGQMARSAKAFVTETSAKVDGVMWYTVYVSPNILEWLSTMPTKMRYNHVNSNGATYTVDMHEHLYNIMVLRWG